MLVWVNLKEMKRQEERPSRIRLADGSTRTGLDISNQELVDSGWYQEEFIDKTNDNAVPTE
jgi:hypothetical protein